METPPPCFATLWLRSCENYGEIPLVSQHPTTLTTGGFSIETLLMSPKCKLPILRPSRIQLQGLHREGSWTARGPDWPPDRASLEFLFLFLPLVQICTLASRGKGQGTPLMGGRAWTRPGTRSNAPRPTGSVREF